MSCVKKMSRITNKLISCNQTESLLITCVTTIIFNCSVLWILFYYILLKSSISIFRLLGGYDRLEQVRVEDALQDLTGGVLDTIPFNQLADANDLRRIKLFETLTEGLAENALVFLHTKVLFLNLCIFRKIVFHMNFHLKKIVQPTFVGLIMTICSFFFKF